MNGTACLLCGSPGPFRHRHTKDGYAIQGCRQCRLVQLVPRPAPETLRALYESASYFGGGDGRSGYSAYASQEREYLLTFAEDVRRIGDFLPRGRLLEVGCGYGYFLRCALAAGHDAYGIDVSPAAVEHAARLHPGRVFEGVLEDASRLGDQPFDAIFAAHVIEHLVDPLAFLRAARRRLRPGGLLVLVTPNIGSLLSRVSGRRWVSFKVPEHVGYYDPGTMTELLRRGGFTTRAIDSAYQYYALPFVASRLRELLAPVSRLVPHVEHWPLLRDRCVRVSSGSLRAVAVAQDGPGPPARS